MDQLPYCFLYFFTSLILLGLRCFHAPILPLHHPVTSAQSKVDSAFPPTVSSDWRNSVFTASGNVLLCLSFISLRDKSITKGFFLIMLAKYYLQIYFYYISLYYTFICTHIKLGITLLMLRVVYNCRTLTYIQIKNIKPIKFKLVILT